MLHKHSPDKKIESKEGQRQRLCSNKFGKRCPSLDIDFANDLASESEALDYLANILVRIFLSQRKNAPTNFKRN